MRSAVGLQSVAVDAGAHFELIGRRYLIAVANCWSTWAKVGGIVDLVAAGSERALADAERPAEPARRRLSLYHSALNVLRGREDDAKVALVTTELTEAGEPVGHN